MVKPLKNIFFSTTDGPMDRVHKYYKDCSNDDLERPCLFFTAGSNLLSVAIWENARKKDFMGTVGVFGLKIGIQSSLFYPITLRDRWGTTYAFATFLFNSVMASADLVELAKSIPVHALILSSHLFCLPFFRFVFFYCAL